MHTFYVLEGEFRGGGGGGGGNVIAKADKENCQTSYSRYKCQLRCRGTFVVDGNGSLGLVLHDIKIHT